MLSATYSPEDNKLRLYADARLSRELYERVRAAGFVWAAKQKLFVAPAWTPEREDLLRELCGEIGDEDTSLVERAEERADRFEDYHDKRESDAGHALAAVERITDGIPLGQPILVGHHSEKRARREAERIEAGMRAAVRLWQTAKYWTDRAAGAIRHAKYKERPPVRARRIKGLESDQRRHEREKQQAERFRVAWLAVEPITRARAMSIANHPGGGGPVTLADWSACWSAWSALDRDQITPEEARRQCVERLGWVIERADRWLAHLGNRLAYERAMLAESGGTPADRVRPEVGGGCRCWASPRGGWSYIRKVNRVSVTIADNWGNGGANFTRTVPFDQLAGVMTRAEVDAARSAGRLVDSFDGVGFFVITDTPSAVRLAEPGSEPADPFEKLADALKAGVKVVSAPQLFPTPPELARRIVELSSIRPRMTVLEPSAGTGSILQEIPADTVRTAVEINPALAASLRERFGSTEVLNADFLSLNGELGLFDRIVMNPPFGQAEDIRHVEHARSKLKPGGRLVAIVANCPRQRAKLQPLAVEWIDLPAGSFAEQGTGVNAAIVVIDG